MKRVLGVSIRTQHCGNLDVELRQSRVQCGLFRHLVLQILQT